MLRSSTPMSLGLAFLGAVALCTVCAAEAAWARASGDEAQGADAAATTNAATPARAEPLQSVARGLFFEGRVGGGYMVADAKIESDPIFPGVVGKSEGFGPGASVSFALGYDVTPRLALQALGGALLVSGTRTKQHVRDLGVLYGGVGGRLAFDLTDRLDLLTSLGGAFAKSDNAVEEASTGPAVLGGVGLEYYVHVRHFSVGLELTVFAPLSPTRVFVGVSPLIKYTF